MHEFPQERFLEVPQSSLEELYIHKKINRALQEKEIDVSKCAVFLDKTGEGIFLRVIDFHHRTIDKKLDDSIEVEKDSYKNVYAYLDLKGVGFISPATYESKKEGIEYGSLGDVDEIHLKIFSPETPWGYDVLGLFDERMATQSVKWANKLESIGVRSEVFAAVYRLNNIWIRGEQKPVTEFIKEQSQKLRDDANNTNDLIKQEQVLKMAEDFETNFQPVIAIRCMRSVFRIRDLYDSPDVIAKLMLKEAIDNLKQESIVLNKDIPDYNIDLQDGLKEYIKTIIGWVSYNLGILQKEGLCHNYLHMGNISLAGEVVDLDSMYKGIKKVFGKAMFSKDVPEHLKQENKKYGIPYFFYKDIRDSLFSCKKLIERIKKLGYEIPTEQEVNDIFMDSWLKGISEINLYESIGVPFEKLKNGLEQMVKDVILYKVNLKTLQKELDFQGIDTK